MLKKEEAHIQISDWWKMIVFFIFMNISRFIMIFVFLYLLKKTGDGFNFKEYVIASWGGLRGALSIALALIISEDELLPLRARNLIMFNSVSMSCLSLLINGTTCEFILKKLKLIKNNE
jgi:NhaP-type Na+/H+ or K+/H+ antiporter